MRMDADRAPDVGIAFGDRAHTVELGDLGADGDHRADPGGAGPGDDRVALLGEIREIQMAMAVDELHRRVRLSRPRYGETRLWAVAMPSRPAPPCPRLRAPRNSGHPAARPA